MAELTHANEAPDDASVSQIEAVKDQRPIWEILAEMARNHPLEELDKIPHDGALNHDHYLYGFPKKSWDE